MVVVVGKSRARVSDLSRGWGRGSEWSVAANWVVIVAAVSGGKGSGSWMEKLSWRTCSTWTARKWSRRRSYSAAFGGASHGQVVRGLLSKN